MNTLKSPFRINQTVAYEFGKGEWKVISKTNSAGFDCWRYDIQNKKTNEILKNIRDKELADKKSTWFELFAN